MSRFFIYFLFLAFFLEISFKFKLSSIQGLSLFNLATYLMIVWWILLSAIRRRLNFQNKLNPLIFALIIVVASSIPIKLILKEVDSVNLKNDLVILKNWLEPFLLFYLFFSICDTKKLCNHAIACIVIVILMSVVMMFLDIFNVMSFASVHIGDSGRSSGFKNTNEYSIFLVIVLPLLFSFALHERAIPLKVLFHCCAIISLLALIFTGSRGGFLAFLIAIWILGSHLKKIGIVKRHSFLPVVLGLLFFGLVVSIAIAPNLDQSFLKRLDPRTSHDIEKYSSNRLVIWKSALHLVIQRPIFGHGFETFRKLLSRDYGIDCVSHNVYLAYLFEQGVVGLLVFLYFLCRIYSVIHKDLKDSNDTFHKILCVSYISGFAGYAAAMFTLNYYTGLRSFFWIYTALVLRYGALNQSRRNWQSSW